jgi:hypothetical protein
MTILHQMNAVTAPAPVSLRTAPVRQIGNYFFLLTTMMKMGLQLIWEKQHGLKYFSGVMDTPGGRALYDEIVRCVMRPEEEDPEHFAPHEIDAIAERLARRGTKTSEALEYVQKVVIARLESENLESDGDTHQPPFAPLGWVTPMPDNDDVIEFRDT